MRRAQAATSSPLILPALLKQPKVTKPLAWHGGGTTGGSSTMS